MARQGYETWSCGYRAGAGQTKCGGKRTSNNLNFVAHDTILMVAIMKETCKDERGTLKRIMMLDMQ
eukprot:16340311-Heterocapsa_arctica.AAC.1